jgi:hypothetical protein
LTIVFDLKRNPPQLKQYYHLREKCFRQEFGLPEFDGSEDSKDRQGLILLAHQDGQCIGGVRISSDLPVHAQLHDLDLAQEACCIWERFVLAPEVRTELFFRAFCAHLVEFSRSAGYQYALVLSSLRNARFYRKCHFALGVEFKIYGNVPSCAQGTFAGLEHYLSVAKLQDSRPLGAAA